MKKDEPTSIDIVKVVHVTDLAVLVRLEEGKTEDGNWDEWIPFSLIEDPDAIKEDMKQPVNRRKLTSIEVPLWKAEELGLD